MRRHALLAAVLLAALSAPAQSAQPGLNLQVLHIDALVGDVALPLVGTAVAGLDGLPALDLFHGVEGVVPVLVFEVALPLAGAVLGSGGLPALPPLEGLDGLVTGVVSDVALPLVGGVVSGGQ